jgi:hypothetical protein
LADSSRNNKASSLFTTPPNNSLSLSLSKVQTMTPNPLASPSNEAPSSMHQTAANTFFHNPDLCTLLTQTLLSITLTSKTCQTPSPTSPLLPFRGITRSAYNAVMLEHPARVALGLDPQDVSAAGAIIKSLDPKGGGEMIPYISHREVDVSTLLAREIEEEEEEEKEEGGEVRPYKQHTINAQRRQRRQEESPRIARIFTHHPAAAHQTKYDPLDGTTLYIHSEAFFLCSSLPLARGMFLTQPPQKRIQFGVRYEYSPGTRRYFTLHNEAGIRFGELVEFFEREPGMIKQAVDPNVGLGRYWRWLRDEDFIWMNRLEWEVERGAVKGGELWSRAIEDGEKGQESST